MIKYLLLILTIIGTTNLFAQENYSDTTFIINKQTFRIQTKAINPDHLILTILRDSKTIQFDTIDAGGFSNLEFLDFDKDGNMDIMIPYMGNNVIAYLYQFDKITNTFKIVDGFERFPEAIQLKSNPKLYYSYHRAGCADMNWISDLFYIDNFKSIRIGHIYGQGCDFEVQQNPQVIMIYKIIDNKDDNEMVVEKLPYLKNIPAFADKWSFINRYWEKYYTKFI